MHFLYYLFLWKREFFYSSAYGAAIQNINTMILREMEVTIPSLTTQKKISGVLSSYDDLIENNSRRIAILEAMAQALYREWFVRFRFPGHESVPIVPSPLGDIPQGWNVVKVEDAVHINPSTIVPRDGEKHFVPMGAVPHNTMLIDESQVEMRTGNSGSKFKNGDTLFARITPCLENGKTAFVAFLTTEHDVAFGSTEFIVLRSKSVSPEYVYLLARSDPFRDNAIKSMSGATGRQRVQEKCFDKFLIAHPGRRTIDAFSMAVKPMFQAVFNLAKNNAVLRKTRDLLLPKVISGQLDVEHLDIDVGEPVMA
jgi:type I restriction enzyme S subunit